MERWYLNIQIQSDDLVRDDVTSIMDDEDMSENEKKSRILGILMAK